MLRCCSGRLSQRGSPIETCNTYCVGVHDLAPGHTVAQARVTAGPGRLLSPPAPPRRHWLLILSVQWTRPPLPQRADAVPAMSATLCEPSHQGFHALARVHCSARHQRIHT